jgi:hypothetical protein
MCFNHVARIIVNRMTASCERLRCLAYPIAFVPAYHSRPNGSASEIRSTSRLSWRGRTSTHRLHSFFVESNLIVCNCPLMASAKRNKSGRSTIGSRRIGSQPRRKTAAKMRKSRIPDQVLKGNAAKYLSYRQAWARIGAAQGHGFYLEAVTIVESVITDRLISYLVGIGVLARPSR